MGSANKDQLRQDVFGRLKKIFIKLLKVMQEKHPEDRPQIGLETDLVDDLGIDSVETLDLMNAIEEEFNIIPNVHDANWRRKISEVVDYIVELLEEKESLGR